MRIAWIWTIIMLGVMYGTNRMWMAYFGQTHLLEYGLLVIYLVAILWYGNEKFSDFRERYLKDKKEKKDV